MMSREFGGKIKKIVKRLHLILKWTREHSEIAVLCAEDFTVYVSPSFGTKSISESCTKYIVKIVTAGLV